MDERKLKYVENEESSREVYNRTILFLSRYQTTGAENEYEYFQCYYYCRKHNGLNGRIKEILSDEEWKTYRSKNFGLNDIVDPKKFTLRKILWFFYSLRNEMRDFKDFKKSFNIKTAINYDFDCKRSEIRKEFWHDKLFEEDSEKKFEEEFRKLLSKKLYKLKEEEIEEEVERGLSVMEMCKKFREKEMIEKEEKKKEEAEKLILTERNKEMIGKFKEAQRRREKEIFRKCEEAQKESKKT